MNSSHRDGRGDNMHFFYDAQIRRYLIQFVRVFSHFHVQENTRTGVRYNRVPCRYADSSRMVQHLLRNNSENVIASAPMITVSIKNLNMSETRRQEPFHTNREHVVERKFDRTTNRYTQEPGNLYTVEKHMPVPYDLDLEVDIWTTNLDTKHQLLEQILVLFNPSLQLQDKASPLDWSNVTELTLTDVTYSNRSLPTGVDDVIDIASLTFDATMWLNPPAKVKRQKLIDTIVANLHSTEDIQSLDYNNRVYDFFRQYSSDDQIIVTPGDMCVRVDRQQDHDIITLMDETGRNPRPWQDLIELHGEFSADSMVSLNTGEELENHINLIYGKLLPTTDPAVMKYDLISDTLPRPTMADVDQVVDPENGWPGNNIDPQQHGQRYLLAGDIRAGSAISHHWENLVAHTHDVIEYVHDHWQVVFSSQNSHDVHYVYNKYSHRLYTWNGEYWSSVYEATYKPGYWRIHL